MTVTVTDAIAIFCLDVLFIYLCIDFVAIHRFQFLVSLPRTQIKHSHFTLLFFKLMINPQKSEKLIRVIKLIDILLRAYEHPAHRRLTGAVCV